MSEKTELSLLELLQTLAEDTLKSAEIVSCSSGYRGGLALGLKDSRGKIWMYKSEVNPQLSSMWGEKDYFSNYAALKLGTALELERDNPAISDEYLPLVASHRGACVFFYESRNAWMGIGYSGLTEEEDFHIARMLLKEIFFL